MSNLGIVSLQKKKLGDLVLATDKSTQGPSQSLAEQPMNSAPGLAKKRRRPPYSYTALIGQAILASETKQLTLREIYESINDMYPQICQGPDVGWQNTIRHNLSLNQCFKRIPRHQLPPNLSSKLRGKGSYWTVDIELMDPNTRKRLEEAVASDPASRAHQGGAFSNPAVAKRARYSHTSEDPSSYKLYPEIPANTAAAGAANLRLSDMGRLNFSPQHNHLHPFYMERDVQYVSPVVQSPSPYFQGSISSPIVVSTPPLKQVQEPVPTGRIHDTGVELPPLLPLLSSAQQQCALPRTSHIRCSSERVNSSSLRRVGKGHRSKFREIPMPHKTPSSPADSWDNLHELCSFGGNNHSSAIPSPLPQYSFGANVSCTRSTAAPPSRQDGGSSRLCSRNCDSFERQHPHTSLLSSSESYPPSSCSLSPASTVLPYSEGTASNGPDYEHESDKLSINHLLN